MGLFQCSCFPQIYERRKNAVQPPASGQLPTMLRNGVKTNGKMWKVGAEKGKALKAMAKALTYCTDILLSSLLSLPLLFTDLLFLLFFLIYLRLFAEDWRRCQTCVQRP